MARRVAVIGLDCADPRLVFDTWLADLPTLARLMRRGVWGSLMTIDPPISVPAWSCMASSLDPGQLGVYGFRNRKDYSYAGLVTADSTWLPRGEAVWDLLGAAGKHVILLGVPQTYPPLAVSGELISCFLTPNTRSASYTYPENLRVELEALIGGPYNPDVQDFRSEDRDRILVEIYEMTEQRFAIARHLLSSRPWDFLMMHEIGLDRIQHAFWRFMDHNHRDYQPNHRYHDVIRDYYQYLDSQIEDLLDFFDDDTTVLVVSDHGSQKMEGAICINEWLAREGYLVFKEAPREVLPLAQASVDWAQTRAWGEGGHYSRLCLNLRGREPDGTVDPGDYEALREELCAGLEALGGPDGQPIGTRVYKPEALWAEQRGVPPDLVVYFGDLAWRSNGSVGSGQIYSFNNDTGPDDANHTREGIFVMAGPGVRPGRRDGLTIYDVAPTILEQFGVHAPARMSGRGLRTRFAATDTAVEA